MTEQLDINQIAMDGGTQARFATNSQVAEDYAVAIDENGGAWPFPPIVVFHDGQTHWLADGFHRVTAARRMLLTAVPADIRQGTRRDAVLYAAGANADHGLQRTNKDKERAVKHLLQDEEWGKWSTTKIADVCHVSKSFVSELRRSLFGANSEEYRTYVDKHGNVSRMRVAGINDSRAGGREPLSSEELVIAERSKGGGCIYIASDGRGHKIGYTTKVRSRIQDLRVANISLQLQHVIPCQDQGLEQQLHSALAGRRIEREWFELDDSVLARLMACHSESDLQEFLATTAVMNTGNIKKPSGAGEKKPIVYHPVHSLEVAIDGWLRFQADNTANRLASIDSLKATGAAHFRWADMLAALPTPHRGNDVIQAINNVADIWRQQWERENEGDLRKRLRECLESDRLSQFREIGLTDEQLREYISHEWNTLTGSGGPNWTQVCCKGGADPAFYYNAYSSHGIKPTLRGTGLLRMAREVLEIPYPANERGIVTVPNRQVHAAVKQLRDRGYEVVHYGDINKWAVDGTRMEDDEVWAFLDNVLDEEEGDDTAVVLNSEHADAEEDPCRVAVRVWITREDLTLDDLLQMVDRPGTRPGWWASLIRLRPPGFSGKDMEDMVLQVLASDYGIQRTAVGEKSGQAAPSAYTPQDARLDAIDAELEAGYMALLNEPEPTAPETAVPTNGDSGLLAAVTPTYQALLKMEGGQRRRAAMFLKHMASDEPQEIGDLFRALSLFVNTFEG